MSMYMLCTLKFCEMKFLQLLLLLLAWIQKNRNKQFVQLGQGPLKVSISCHLPIIIKAIFERILGANMKLSFLQKFSSTVHSIALI